MINAKQIITWYTIGKPMVERATNTCILFRNIAAKQVEKGNARFTANHVQIRYWTSLYLTFNKLHSRNSLNLGNCHFPFTYKEDEKTKLLVFLSKLFLNLHFSLVSNSWKKKAFVRISTRVTIWWPAYLNRPGSLCPCDFYPGITWSVACVVDVISSRLVTSAKQHRYPCSGNPKDRTNYRKYVLNFPFTLIGILTMTYLKSQSRRVIKSWYIGGGQEQRFRPCLPEGLIFD